MAENSLTEDQVIIPAGHEYGTLIAKVNPRCSTTGKQAHFKCSACDKLFDESKNEKTLEELTIAVNPNAHDFDVWNDEVPATCVSEGTKAHKDCKLCHKHYADDSTTEITNLVIPIDPHGHDLETTWTGVKDGHYHICKNGCTAGRDELQGHNPDRTEATETDPVKCTVCDYIITPAIGHTHNLTVVSGYGATCTTEGRKTYYKCSGCEAKFKDEEGTQELTDESWLVIPMAHQFGEWQDEVPATTEHDGTKAHKDCDFCHKHFDNEDNEIEDITIAKLPASEGEDDTPTVTEKKGLPGGAIAGIVIGTAMVVSLGGFAIFWFAIKKKSFAELMEAIKSMFKKKTPTLKVKVKGKRNIYEEDNDEKYKALPPEIRDKFLEALNKDEANFIKPLCITLMFAGLRIGEALALKWKNIDFKNKSIKVERAITQVPKFDEQGNVKDRKTVIGDTKTTCSVRDIPVTDIVLETLRQWKDKQIIRQNTNPQITANLTLPTSFVFANDDGSYRTYSGTRVIFDRFKHRNGLDKYHIHFHGLRHTFSNMLFEMNENPKVIQQLLGHKDVKTTVHTKNRLHEIKFLSGKNQNTKVNANIYKN